MEQVKIHFRPEFINRIDEIIVFHPLSKDNLTEISKLLLKNVEKKLESLKLRIEITDKARHLLISKGTDFEYGARPLKRTIQKEIEDPISEIILEGKLEGKSVIRVDVDQSDRLKFTES